MYQAPDYFRTASLKLSKVLHDIGVSDRLIQKRRRMAMLKENIDTCTTKLMGSNMSLYNYGSQSEGATTVGLQSDVDTLVCYDNRNVIQDLNEWKCGKDSLLMILNDTTSPGYCLVQELKNNEPSPLTVRGLDTELLKNSHSNYLNMGFAINGPSLSVQTEDFVINGPAISVEGEPGGKDRDIVPAYRCKSWPAQARSWLIRQGIGRWPSDEMKEHCETLGCFIVSVSSKSGLNEEFEWRISTSEAERFLMFKLNITQIRCYVLMKMILKTFINPQCDSAISSFMCKTVLFYCIQNTQSNNWRRSNILACLTNCLVVLQSFVRSKNCPHFIIPENNLFAGKISSRNKVKVLDILENVIQSGGLALLQIPIDDLGSKLQAKMNMGGVVQSYLTPGELHAYISVELLTAASDKMQTCHWMLLEVIAHDRNFMVHERLYDILCSLTETYVESDNTFKKSAIKVLTPLLSSSLGSVIASHDIGTNRCISTKALACFSVGLNSDVSSGRLKLASALYCAGDMERTEFVLRKTEEKYDLNTVEPVCGCHVLGWTLRRWAFAKKCVTGEEELVKHITASCVRFLRCESNCVPKELQYEMFRSTQQDMIERDYFKHCWMDWAVVDSLPYLYFLQYKIYSALGRPADQQRALANLVTAIDTEPNLRHRETALNLLGQCMEQENQQNEALCCYMASLNIQTRNNAAIFHICRLLSVMVNRKWQITVQ